MTERERLAAKIRALRAKTVENGCTEAEALSAAAKIAELLQAHNMTLDEADLRASPFGHHAERHDDDVGKRLWKVADAIADLAGVEWCVSLAGVWPIEVSFFGLAHEVEISAYLLEICARAMRDQRDRILANARRLRPAQQRNIVNPFLDGMADRLAERIRDLMPPPPPPGTGLVVVRAELLQEAVRAAGVTIRETKLRSGQDGGELYDLGREAGEGVALNPAVRAGGEPLRLGGS